MAERIQTILIVDDDARTRETLRRVLTSAGYDVHQASDGRRGLDFLQSTAVDLVILDIFMPELDGIVVITRMRKDFPNIPVLAVSGGGMLERNKTLEIAQLLGASDTLAKPFDKQTLLSMVEKLLGRSASS